MLAHGSIESIQKDFEVRPAGNVASQCACFDGERRPVELFVEIVKTDPQNSDAALGLLSARTGNTDDGNAGIGGPYLKELTEYALDVNEGKFEKTQSRPPLTMFGIPQAVVYLDHHPDDRQTPRSYGQRAETSLPFVCRSKGAVPGNKIVCNFGGSSVAVLDRLGLLKNGMTKDEAIELLGHPQRDDGASLQWLALRPGFENPLAGRLTAELKDGKVGQWKHLP